MRRTVTHSMCMPLFLPAAGTRELVCVESMLGWLEEMIPAGGPSLKTQTPRCPAKSREKFVCGFLKGRWLCIPIECARYIRTLVLVFDIGYTRERPHRIYDGPPCIAYSPDEIVFRAAWAWTSDD